MMMAVAAMPHSPISIVTERYHSHQDCVWGIMQVLLHIPAAVDIGLVLAYCPVGNRMHYSVSGTSVWILLGS